MNNFLAIECKSGQKEWWDAMQVPMVQAAWADHPNNVVTKVHKRKVRDQRCQEELYYPKQDGRACILCPQKDG